MLVLALEASTSAAKAALYDTEKGLVGTVRENFQAADRKGGRADPDRVYHSILRAGRKLAGGKTVAAIALSNIWHSLIVCTHDLVPVTPLFTWECTDAAELCIKIRSDAALADELYRRTGCMPHYSYPRHMIQHLRGTGLDCDDKMFLSQGSYQFYRMTGNLCESISTQCGSGVVNVETLHYDPWVLEYLHLREDQFPPMSTYRDTHRLLPEAAAELRVPKGIPVVPSYPDGAMNQVGSHAGLPGIMTLSVGTSGAVRVSSEKPFLPEESKLWCYYGVDRWISGAATSGACNCLDWFCNCFANDKTFDELDALSEKERDLPIFLPFLFGERCPGWHNVTGGDFMGLKQQHTVASCYRAVKIGVLFNLRQCYEALCAGTGEPNKIIVSGGIVHSQQWLQMLADIFKRELFVSSGPDVSSLGAVALALHAAGALEKVDDFNGDCGRQFVKIKPQKKEYQYYDEQYRRYLEYYYRIGI